ncbi:hypothetical protein [Paenibacillus sp. PAMC 26794]|uniref:hypothetical protein n=1 Tax=Paenibacillus sp. PAMC 26794 TaxID=1257080 RepID=UPI0002F12299|nr:hypothetical protein [Paenibacillus sp. PAMC 26794]
MKKVFLLSILSLLLAVSVYAASASSDQKPDRILNVNQPVTPITVEEPDQIITPMATSTLFHTPLATRPSDISEFYVRAGYGHIKIFIKNTGKSTMTVTMKHSSDKVYIEDSIPAGGTLDWKSYIDYPQGVRGGDYEISYRAGGNNLSAEAWGISAENTNEL